MTYATLRLARSVLYCFTPALRKAHNHVLDRLEPISSPEGSVSMTPEQCAEYLAVTRSAS